MTPPDTPEVFEPVVFPDEAELGGTAAIAIDSNYIPRADEWERYDLHPDDDTVEIHLVDEDEDEVAATVRGVFNLQAAPTSALARTHPGAFVTVALFDLPESPAFTYSSGTFVSDVLVTIRDVRVDDFKGRIRIKGTGGVPTALAASGLTPPMEPLLAPQTEVIRLRPVLQSPSVPDGFPAEAEIGGLQADIDYFAFCVTKPRGYASSGATGATVHFGPAESLTGWVYRAPMVMTRFHGFTLGEDPLGGGDPDLAGEGPMIDIVFGETTGAGTCGPANVAFVTVRNLFVVDPEGETLIDLRGPTDPDSTHLFQRYAVDRD